MDLILVPCSNCNRMLVTSVPSGYTNGFLMMNTFYTGDCINVELSCSAPDVSYPIFEWSLNDQCWNDAGKIPS